MGMIKDGVLVQQSRLDEYKRTPAVSKLVKSMNLDTTHNETILFHGAPGANAIDPRTGEQKTSLYDAAQTLRNTNFDNRIASNDGMLGYGMYFSDNTQVRPVCRKSWW